MFFWFLSYLLILIMVLVSVAFITLLERKMLGYIQIRKGPNKVGVLGLFQPFSDAIKLFIKELSSLETYNLYPFLFSPIFGLSMALILWMLYPSLYYFIDMKWGVLFFLSCSSVSVYSILVAGWSSNSKYAILGAYRGVAQTISYEVSFALILFSLLMITSSFNLKEINNYQLLGSIGIFMFPLLMVWFSSCLAETNRTPFDFTEGESELVSGFNVEYMGVGFALIFMAEYANIILMSMMTAVLFFGPFFISLKVMMFSILFLWVRGSYPRFRYDKLMNLAWKMYLPLALNYVMIVLSMKTIFILY
uniref:NADH-ubiquinone oxidoreductase chain 1 n=1 Tax=Centruroides vittatus TaxID=120091 RepID=A0A343UQH6_CENVT|nr:NADH dehydrogenase subunit 1 [Centruroides vittatus]AVF96951.1 NADH dehydrogenase subunit 1 [Centruroides vittatus]